MIHKTKIFFLVKLGQENVRNILNHASLTLLKCCNMLESSEQSIVNPLRGLKTQDLHQLCIVPQDFTHHSKHYS